MSASLVGSEMCIRDRYWTFCWCWDCSCPIWRSRINSAWGGDGRHDSGRTCLLYTSDAADDM
eukprot:10411343-Alexandrium_andersonii.AAC.1